MAKYNELYYTVMAIITGAGTGLAQVLGGWDTALQTLVLVMAIDYATGIAIALIWHKSGKTENGAFESGQSVKGLFRKMAYLALVLIAVMLDTMTGANGVVRTAVIMFFIANDGFSILENLGLMGVPYPSVIKNAFEALKSKSE